MSIEVTAILLGLAGSLHCMLMCSPLAMAVTAGKGTARKLIYNAGRVLTYGLCGAAMAAAGGTIDFSGYQSVVTLVLAIGFLAMGLSGTTMINVPFLTTGLARFTSTLKSLFGAALKVKGNGSIFLLGMINGFLPCGVTYLALTYCLTLAGPMDGLNFMLLFGLGTLPAMLGFTQTLRWVSVKLKVSSARIARAGYVFLGITVAARLFIDKPHAIQDTIQGVIMLCQ
jgi:uncharacterized protein